MFGLGPPKSLRCPWRFTDILCVGLLDDNFDILKGIEGAFYLAVGFSGSNANIFYILLFGSNGIELFGDNADGAAL